MNHWRCFVSIVFAASALTGSMTGCREVDPQPSLYADLGEGDRRLLPTPPPPRDPRVKTGQAEFKTFLSPAEKAAKPAQKDAGSDQPNASDEIIAEVRTLIDEYNEVIAAKEYDKAVDFYVDRQRETAASVFATTREVDRLVDELKIALSEKIPDGAARLEKVFASLGGSSSAKLTVLDFKVINDSEVEGKLPPIPMVPTTITFRLLHDEKEDTDFWYIDSPMLAEYDKYRQLVEMGKTQFAAMLEQVKSGAIPAVSILEQLEAATKLIESLTPKETDSATPTDSAREEEKGE